MLRNHSFAAAAWACIHMILKLAKCREIISDYLYCMHFTHSPNGQKQLYACEVFEELLETPPTAPLPTHWP